jgi:hypothetical protein
MTAKQVVQQLLETLPDTCTYEDIKGQIEFFENLRQKQEAVMLGAAASLELERYTEQ